MSKKTNPDMEFTVNWMKSLMHDIEEMEKNNSTTTDFASCAAWHYEYNNMDSLIQNYIGNMPDFLTFLQEEWGWKITVSEDEKVILIDENKDFCVCPVMRAMEGNVSKYLCHCSEAFAKKMFSAVAGKEVKATVIRSILRDGKSCMYEIRL